ncbi:hypothetical protein Q4Q39_04985 [Flavivirga amylovorans]|uniref:DUF4468 domain-containing protein n=1 Tax=Flavivirga amylovorans TaxID=870486 RepID=A0ABT8WYP8_9FLAO|nr:hypothetical protein [Flavivirga amylovorans]MDO5986757.1 hypothetical protein [Flavivirga amylovorans]
MNLKRIALTVLVVFTTNSLLAQKKRDLIKEIESYEKSVVGNASFDKDHSEVWNAIYIIASEEYNTISRESESKGYIEAIQETTTYKEHITIEIRGDKPPYRVSFQVKQERRTKKEDGSLTNWESFTSNTLQSYYFRLQKRLFELLNGPLELSEKLNIKIEQYNSKQSKARKKVLKGKDY